MEHPLKEQGLPQSALFIAHMLMIPALCLYRTFLVSIQDISSWNTLLTAAKIRNCLPVLNISSQLKEGKLPQIQYHQKCRSVFTLKKTLDSIKSKDNPSTATYDTTIRGEVSTTRVYDAKCIICSKKKQIP